MKFLALVALLGLALPLVGSKPTGTLAPRHLPFNPPAPLSGRAPATAPAPRPLTNAQRFARGLGPAPPKHMFGRAKGAGALAPRTCPSAVTLTGVVQLFSGGTPYGYVNAAGNIFSEYNVASDLADALTISFTPACAAGPIPLSIVGSEFAETFFGAIDGFSAGATLGSGSFNYAYLGATDETAAGALPADGANSFTDNSGVSEDIESTIWTYNVGTDSLTAQWVNPDGSFIDVVFGYYPTDDALFLTADFAAFEAEFGTATELTLKFVPA